MSKITGTYSDWACGVIAKGWKTADLSCLSRALRPTGITPIYLLKKVSELRCRYLQRLASSTRRPDELPSLKMLCVKGHAHAIMPKQLHEIASTSKEAKDLASMWVTVYALLHLQSQRIHAAPHVSHPAPAIQTLTPGGNAIMRPSSSPGSAVQLL